MQQATDFPDEQAHADRAQAQDRIDRQLARYTQLAFDASALEPGVRVLDVGCGAGRTTLDLALRVAPTGHAIGLDISPEALDAARYRQRCAAAHNVEFVFADAQSAPFVPRSVDRVFSRFGVMFFEDPLAAFRNLAGALRPTGRIVFLAWCAPEQNPWMSLPTRIVERVLPELAPARSDAARMFSLADPAVTRRILEEAGFSGVELRRCETAFRGVSLEATAAQLMQAQNIAGALACASADARHRVRDALLHELAPYVSAEGVQLPSAAWLVTASPALR